MNIFAQATKQKLRIQSTRGLLTVEDLWDLPLQSTSNINLEHLADSVEAKIGEAPKRSRITKQKNTNPTMKLTLDILEYIIDVKLQAKEDAVDAVTIKARKALLINALAAHETKELEGMSAAAIKKELASI